MKYLILLLMLVVAVQPAKAADNGTSAEYERLVGKPVRLFEEDALDYSLDLQDLSYTFIDFRSQVAEASFAALKLNPHVISLVIQEDAGIRFSPEQYLELVKAAMMKRFEDAEELEFKSMRDLGEASNDGLTGLQVLIEISARSKPMGYVVTTVVDGSAAYQLLTFGDLDEDALLAEANAVWNGFSLKEKSGLPPAVLAATDVADFRSETFGFAFKSDPAQWFAWPEIADTYPYAALGALSTSGYGAVVMPFCWKGDKPTEQSIVSVMLAQFGEKYPTEFIKSETAIEKNDASGRLLTGRDVVDGSEFEYHIRVVANEHCAFALAGWGEQSARGLQRDIEKLWNNFHISNNAGAPDDVYASERERINNAYHLNSIGLHYYESRAYRDAFRFFSQASDLHQTDGDYLINALRALVEIDAYKEAYEWLTPRINSFPDNQLAQSWDAWLAYQNDDTEKSMRIYGELFANGYREDDDFSVYVEMLADAGLWEKLDAEFNAYADRNVTESLQLLKTGILSRRGRYEEALAVLDEMQEGRPFNAELVYKRIAVYYEMGDPPEVLRLADSLIEHGYRSLESYFYKGDSEFQLRSYLKARESFEIALTYSPAHSTIKEYLDAINSILGEDDNSAIASSIDPVPLPNDIRKRISDPDYSRAIEGYGAFYLTQLVGFEFDGGEWLTRTVVRQIKIIDDNGVKNFSTLEFDFNPGFEQLFVNELVVRNAEGEEIAVGDPDSYYITHSDSGFEASNEQTVHIPVPNLSPGVVIEATISKRISVEKGEFPLELIYFSDDRPVDYSAVFISGDIDRIRFESLGADMPRKKGNTLTWQVANPLVYRWEPLQPYFDQILPWVYIGTVDESWSLAGRNYVDEIGDKLDFNKISAQAGRLVEDTDSTARRIEKLSAYVQQEVHYEAIEFGRRAYIPKTARETLRDRYGDCKDHAVLLYSMLKANDISASLALVNLNQQVLPGLPNIDQFDHMIVAVETEDGPMFIDPTDKDLHLGQFSPRSMASNYALVLGSEPELLQIPDYQHAQIGLRVEREIGRDDDGYLTVVETGHFSGYQAAELRGQLRQIETSELQPSMQRWVSSRYNDAEVTDYFVENVFDASNDLIIELQYRLPIDDDGSFDVPGFFEAHYFEFERVADRRFPFEQDFPLRVSSVTALKFTDVDRLEVLRQKPESDETRFGNWRKRIDQGAGSWVISFEYVANTSRFEPGDYRDFAEFHRKLVNSIEQPLIIN